jgi:biotin carboxyl carrier protein
MIKRLRVTVDGNTYDVTVEVQDDGSPAATHPPIAAAPPQAPVVASAPAAPAAAPAPVAAPAASGGSGPGDVPSPLSGRVTAVMVQAGQSVTEGDHLVTLEAMKMNTFVFAPRSGKITGIKTEVGAVVNEGQVLISIG